MGRINLWWGRRIKVQCGAIFPGGGRGKSKFSAAGGQHSPIGPSRENSRKGTIFASFLSIIDGIYVITKTMIQKTMNYIAGER